MDPKLFNAARSGDVSFLKEAIASQPPDDYSYFLSLSYDGVGAIMGTIFHLAAWEGQVEFFKEAMERLPTELILVLLSQTDWDGENPLHSAAYKNIPDIVRLILGFYKSYTPPPSPSPSPSPNNNDLHKPWLALNNRKETPLHCALSFGKGENAMEILSMDMELVCTMVDNLGNSPLFLAVKKGCNQVAEKILMSSFSYSVSGYKGSTPLHVAPNSSAWKGKVEFFKEAMERLPAELILVLLSQPGYLDMNPLHLVAFTHNNLEIIRLILGFYKSYTPPPSPNNVDLHRPWLARARLLETPLHMALKSGRKEESAMEILSMDMELLCSMVDKEGNSPLFLAVKGGLNQVAEKILTMSSFFCSLSGPHGSTALHVIAPNSSDVVLRLLLAKHQDVTDVVDDEGCNALHMWAYEWNVWPLKFLLEEEELTAARTKVFRDLITYTTEKNTGDSPLHIAVREKTGKSEEFVQVLVQGIQQEMKAATTSELPADCSPSPWKIQNNRGNTPLHTAIENKNQAYALKFLSADPTLCYIINNQGESPLSVALKIFFNFKRLIREILKTMHDLSSSTLHRSHDGVTPLYLLPGCSDDKVKLLMAKHQDLIDVVNDAGYNALHIWAYMGDFRPLKLLLEEEELTAARTKVFRDLITYTANKDNGNSPLHIAARQESEEFVRVLVQGIQQEMMRAATTSELPHCAPSPWKIQNYYGNTPLHTAIENKNKAHALQFLSVDPTSCHIINNQGESPLFIALKMSSNYVKFGKVIKEILKMDYHPFSTLHSSHDGDTVLHLLAGSECSVEIGELLLKKFWWMMNLRNNRGNTALDTAKIFNFSWLVNLLANPSLIQKEPFNWMKACERPDEKPALLAFVDTSHDLQAVCREQKDTPLHHIELQNDAEYVNFLTYPSIAKIKNMTNAEGVTPLHRALQRKNILLAKTLLNDSGVERTIEDNNGTTAMDLLAKLFKEDDEWAKMCREIRVYPFLRTMYLKPDKDLDKIRNTLSVVAALLATITFAAGFTLPGGLNSETGDAILAKRAAFLVFLLSDVYAMCTSMLVLFCLIWSMVSARDLSNFLVDRSVLLLMQALYGTLVAFMTGIFAVLAHSSLWAAVIILVMCSIIGIVANRTFLYYVFAWFSHIIYRDRSKKERRDPTRLPEEGNEEHVELITLGESSNLQQV